ncbi:hypothetical protein [Streptomyces lavendofoliae]|uniref:hypothetical protein n=1 Tax=Streptomyces lavendofoliae TaxID=67314 RepID=UPI00300EC634
MNAIRKIATTLGGVTLAVSGVFFAAPAAQADANDCLSYLESKGYSPGDLHVAACSYAERGDWEFCLDILEEFANVPYGVAYWACYMGGME